MSTIHVPTQGFVEELEEVFVLPPFVLSSDEYRRLYESLVAKLRREAAGIQMSTVQTMLIERIASNYVKTKAAESGVIELSNAQQLELSKHVLALQAEFNKLLQQNAENQRAASFATWEAIVFDALRLIEDPKVSKAVAMQIADELQKVGA